MEGFPIAVIESGFLSNSVQSIGFRSPLSLSRFHQYLAQNFEISLIWFYFCCLVFVLVFSVASLSLGLYSDFCKRIIPWGFRFFLYLWNEAVGMEGFPIRCV